MKSRASADRGSFRDPSGQVYEIGGRIYRTVNEPARAAYEAVRASGVLKELAASGRIVSSDEVSGEAWPKEIPPAAYLLEHSRVPFISYPYEWSFSALKAAALLHLDLQRELLDRGFVLSDATAYNVQFVGPRPVFIDVLSIRPYIEGEYWVGHRQFCEQFLNPLLLRALLGVPHNAWFRGSLEGIPTRDFARLLSFKHKLSWNVLSHVTLQANLENRALNAPEAAIERVKTGRKLSKAGYQGLLNQLRNWIDRLQPADTGKTVWGDYAGDNTYSDAEAKEKRDAIRAFAEDVKPKTMIDLGCNTGNYSVQGLLGGAGGVVGFDFDHRAIDLAFSRAQAERLNFLPLWLDAANPSPDQGWMQAERKGFAGRVKADAMVALAFEHHLVIGRNVPMDQAVEWLIDTAPSGIIEWVPKNDSTVRKMLSLREDIFPDYTEEAFTNAIKERARIVGKQVVSDSGRTLFRYQR